MRSFNDIIEYKNVFSKDQFSKIDIILKQPKWLFGHNSITNDMNRFWVMGLENETFFSEEIYNVIKDLTGNEFDISKVYANGQTFGSRGSPHPDNNDVNAYTFLIYANMQWKAEWGGCTIFLNKYSSIDNKILLFDGDTEMKLKHYIPTPNKCLFFPSNIIHYAEAPTRDFYGLRKTVAYKLIRK